MKTIIAYELARVQVQILQIPKYFDFLGIIAETQGNKPILHVIAEDTNPLEPVTIFTFSVGDNIGLFPQIKADEYIGVYLSLNNQDTQLVFG